MSGTNPKWWQRVVLCPPLRFVLPTATTLYFNHHHLRAELKMVELPPDAWARQEAKALLSRSEDRLRSLEAKGPGLAAVAAIVVAGVVAAIIEGNSDATLLGKVLLGIAAWYGIWSLLVPIYLVGPQTRETIDLNHLIVAADKESPEQYLATRAQEAAQGNVRRAQRIGNLQDAARNELCAALAILIVWLALGPAVGLLLRDESPPVRAPQRTGMPATTQPSTTSDVERPTPGTVTEPTWPPQRRPRATPRTPSTGEVEAPTGSQ